MSGIEIDADDVEVGQALPFFRAGVAVPVAVGPELQLGIGAVVGIQYAVLDAVSVAVQAEQAQRFAWRLPRAGRRVGQIHQFSAVVDATVAVDVQYQQRIGRRGPVHGFRNTVGVEVEVNAIGTQADAVAAGVQAERVGVGQMLAVEGQLQLAAFGIVALYKPAGGKAAVG
ncbi:hypothetical protein ACQE3E_23910 (plasmid) [Methylomonas sp. MED-D]|uniref:hypothetical protein n=1 Tax=Methylomonas sp. MED-D TaxID=3418768 RepID=UPI003D03CCA0